MEPSIIGSSGESISPSIAERFFNVAAELVAVVDHDGVVRTLNPTFSALTSTPLDAAAGVPIAQLLRPSDPLALSDLLARVRLGELHPTAEIECNLGARHLVLESTVHVDEESWLFVAKDITERRRLATELSARSSNALAALSNRAGLRDAVELELKMSGSVAVVHIALVDAPEIALEYGDALNDELLQAAVSRIKRNLRDTDLVARLSSHEFAILMAGDDITGSAQRLGKQLVESLDRTFGVKGKRLDVQTAIGVAIGSSTNHTTDSILAASASAAATSEASGQTTMTTASAASPLPATAVKDDELGEELEMVTVNVGGIFRADGQGAMGLEVLLEPKVGAMERIAANTAGERQLLEQIDVASLSEAAHRTAPWLLAHGSRRLCVNVSTDQIREAGLFSRFSAACQRVALDPRQLVIEVDEATINRLGSKADEAIRSIRTEGFRVALDRFGSDGARLASLEQLSFTYLKLDPRLTQTMFKEPVSRGLIAAATTVATAAGTHVIATDVANEEQLVQLQSLGVALVQGPYIHPVEPVQTFASKVASR